MNHPAAIFLLLLLYNSHQSQAQVFTGGSNSRETLQKTTSNLNIQGTYPLNQFLKLNLVDGNLSADLGIEVLDSTSPQRFAVEDSNAIWVVRKRIRGAAAPTYVSVTRYDFDAKDDQFWSTIVTIQSNYIMLSGQIGDNTNGVRVRLMQSNATRAFSFNLTTTTNGQFNQQLNLSAIPSLKELAATHPEEVRKYLAPMLRNMTGRSLFRPGPADVYQAFPNLPANPEISKKLDALLLALEADEFTQRDLASKQLTALGPPGVLAALRRDNSDLTPEAKSRLDLFIASHAVLPPEDLPAAPKDPSFLLDCLDDPDPAVRQAAKTSLESLLNKPIPFDVNTSDAPRAAAIEQIRASIPKPATPATRPTQNSAK